jgi:hypothetical protein
MVPHFVWYPHLCRARGGFVCVCARRQPSDLGWFCTFPWFPPTQTKKVNFFIKNVYINPQPGEHVFVFEFPRPPPSSPSSYGGGRGQGPGTYPRAPLPGGGGGTRGQVPIPWAPLGPSPTPARKHTKTSQFWYDVLVHNDTLPNIGFRGGGGRDQGPGTDPLGSFGPPLRW